MSSRFKDLWDKSKDGSAAQQRSFFRYAIVALGIFVLFLFLKKDNIITWIDAGLTLNRQNRQIENYQQEIKSLGDKIQTLSSNKDSLETYAREQFLFAEPGETVYVVEE